MSWWLILRNFEIWSRLSYLTLLCMLLIIPHWPKIQPYYWSLTFSVAYSTDSLRPVPFFFFFLHVMPFSFTKFCFSLPLHAIWPRVTSNFFSMPPVIWNRLVTTILLWWLFISFQIPAENYSLLPYFCLPALIYLRSYITGFCKVVKRWTLHDGQNSKT